MAAKGSQSKEVITKKILETFPNSFKYDKEIRIPMMEDGNEIQIKITLTAAKTNVECGSDTKMPSNADVVSSTAIDKPPVPTEPTQEEKENLARLIAATF